MSNEINGEGVGRGYQAGSVCIGQGVSLGEGVPEATRSALLSGYLGKSEHLPRLKE